MNDTSVKIAICDDNDIDRICIERLCKTYFAKRNTIIQINHFTSGKELLASVDYFDVLFLDIELGDMNGIDIMKQLEAKPNVWNIIFMTRHNDYMPEAFGPKSIGFIVKPATISDVNHYLAKVENLRLNIEIPFCSNPSIGTISLHDLLWIESDGSYYIVHLLNGQTVTVCGSINNFIAKLNTYLIFRISKGMFVNLYHVSTYTNKMLTLSSGEEKAISPKYIDEFKRNLMCAVRDYKS